MPIRASGSTSVEIDQWDHGISWIAYPHEAMQRASHAIAVDDGEERGDDENSAVTDESPADVWVIDPIDGDGVDESLAELGDVAGVVCCLDRHTRDCAVVATRHDVSVFVPEWMSGVASDLDAPVERFEARLDDSGFRAITVRNSSVPPWQEVALFDGETLYVGDAVGTAPYYLAGGERLGVHPMLRAVPPRAAFRGLDPDRILVGHGRGIREDAAQTLGGALEGARRNAPSVYLNALQAILREATMG